MKQIIFGLDASNLTIKAFKELCRRNAATGATHISLGCVKNSAWHMDGHEDRYPYWITRATTAFKLFVPPELAEWLPVEYARENMEVLRRQGDVLRELGLKGHLALNDPMYLPDGVYQAHPDWRGAQCELPYLTDRAYWAPCVDNPDILDMYRRAIAEICKAAPVEIFESSCNDAGSGLCWDRTYPGPNGPTACVDRPLWERLSGFIGAIEAGAHEAGIEDFTMNVTNTSGSPALTKMVLANFKPNYAIRDAMPDGRLWAMRANMGGYWSNLAWPALGVAQPVKFVEALENGFAGPAPRLFVSASRDLADFAQDLFAAFKDTPTSGPVSRAVFLQTAAAKLVGVDDAETLVQCWLDLDRAVDLLGHVVGAGFSHPLLAITTQKWLIRPLVPNPARLTDNEKAPWLAAFFHARTPADAEDFRNILGQPSFTGNSALWMANKMLGRCIGSVRSIRACIRKLAGRSPEESRLRLSRYEKSLGALACLVANFFNTIRYQHEIRRVRATQAETYLSADLGPSRVSRKPFDLRNIARAEIDNALELIELLKSSDVPLIEQSATPKEEDHLCFSSDLVGVLRHKVDVMQAHWHEYGDMIDLTSGPEDERQITNPQ